MRALGGYCTCIGSRITSKLLAVTYWYNIDIMHIYAKVGTLSSEYWDFASISSVSSSSQYQQHHLVSFENTGYSTVSHHQCELPKYFVPLQYPHYLTPKMLLLVALYSDTFT